MTLPIAERAATHHLLSALSRLLSDATRDALAVEEHSRRQDWQAIGRAAKAAPKSPRSSVSSTSGHASALNKIARAFDGVGIILIMSLSSRFGRRIGPDNPDKLIGQVTDRGDGIVDTLGESHRVRWIVRAGDDAGVSQAPPMKPFEVGMIMSEHGTLVGGCIGENSRVVNALVRSARLLDG
jgi:hypothetical protein